MDKRIYVLQREQKSCAFVTKWLAEKSGRKFGRGAVGLEQRQNEPSIDDSGGRSRKTLWH